MQIDKAIKLFCDYLSIEKSYSPNTIKAYHSDLSELASYLTQSGTTLPILVTNIITADIVGFLASTTYQNQSKKPILAISRGRKLSSIKSFFTFLRKKHFLEISPAEDIDLPNLPYKEPEYLTEEEYQRLIATIQQTATTFFKLRDTLIVSLFLSSGLRVSELVGLTTKHLDLQTKTIKVKRKRDKEQTLPITDEIANLFTQYLATRNGDDTEHIFISKKRLPMQSNTVYRVVRKYLEKANIKKSTYGCHLLRHSCFTSLLAKEVNIVVIQQLAGHQNLNTTRRYLHINNTQVREAINKIEL